VPYILVVLQAPVFHHRGVDREAIIVRSP
jgi:hypothetical protein